MKYLCTVLALSFFLSMASGASKGRPETGPEGGVVFQKISPHMTVEAEVETLESRYGLRVVLVLTAKKSYDNLNYKVQFHPEIDLLESSPLEGQAALAASESLVLKYTFDVRDASEVIALQITAYEEMKDRKRYGVTEFFEVYRPAGTMKNTDEERRFSPEKSKRIFQ